MKTEIFSFFFVFFQIFFGSIMDLNGMNETKPKPVDGWMILCYICLVVIHWNRNISRIFFLLFPIIFTILLCIQYPQLGLESPEPLNGSQYFLQQSIFVENVLFSYVLYHLICFLCKQLAKLERQKEYFPIVGIRNVLDPMALLNCGVFYVGPIIYRYNLSFIQIFSCIVYWFLLP